MAIARQDVLVVGAGPTGLLLALWLHRLGVSVRIIDRMPRPGTASRALGVQARTLEIYRQLGIADRVVKLGLEFTAANIWVRGRKRARAAFGEIGKGISPYPYMLILPQDVHERVLEDTLAGLGLIVERDTELVGFEQDAHGIAATLRHAGGAAGRCEAAYLAGCDGARSLVRETIGAGFPGGTYAHRFYVADAVARGPVANGELHVALDDDDFLAAFPMPGEGHVRLIGTVRAESENAPMPQWQDVSTIVLRRLGVTVQLVNWFSTYQVHHRVAGHFRDRRVFLLGDAAHIHSPVGGQGMNTGLADATNLGWKLAAVLQGRAASSVLDSYEPERIAFARRLVATTDRVFVAATSPGWRARLVRTAILPRLAPWLTRFPAVRRLLFRTISQTAMNYRASPLSEGRAGGVHGGDRMPWVSRPDGDNFAPLGSLDWQAQLHGAASPAIRAICVERGIGLTALAWSEAAAETGLQQGALYLLRPDGHVGLAEPSSDPGTLQRYLDRHGIRGRDS